MTATGTGRGSNNSRAEAGAVLERLHLVINQRKEADPEKSYVAKLLLGDLEETLKKVGEESTELILAAMSGDREEVVRETADLWFHTLVALAKLDIHPDDVLNELRRREGKSGLSEKGARSESAPAR